MRWCWHNSDGPGDTRHGTGSTRDECIEEIHCWEDEREDAEWGCDYCRNDGKLTPAGTCPKCDAQFDTEGDIYD